MLVTPPLNKFYIMLSQREIKTSPNMIMVKRKIKKNTDRNPLQISILRTSKMSQSRCLLEWTIHGLSSKEPFGLSISFQKTLSIIYCIALIIQLMELEKTCRILNVCWNFLIFIIRYEDINRIDSGLLLNSGYQIRNFYKIHLIQNENLTF